MPELTALHIYPLKSAAGLALSHADVEARGLANDRRWMVTDAAGAFLTQRTFPKLALVRVRLTGEGLRLEAPGQEPLDVPVPVPVDGVRMRVQVWNDAVEAAVAGAASAAWLSACLGTDARLVYMPEESIRPVDPAYGRPGEHVSFADAYPLLLATQASLDDLNARLEVPVPMNRFRPNVVVTGTAPFEEDGWRRIRIGAMHFRAVKPCARCVTTTVDQETGAAGKEPLRTLARFRKRNGKVLFGQNLIPEGPGTLRVGDPVEVLEYVA